MNFRFSLFSSSNSKKLRKCPKKRPELKCCKIYDIFLIFWKNYSSSRKIPEVIQCRKSDCLQFFSGTWCICIKKKLSINFNVQYIKPCNFSWRRLSMIFTRGKTRFLQEIMMNFKSGKKVSKKGKIRNWDCSLVGKIKF